MTVAVVVPCRNEAAHISALLDALAGQTRPPDDIIIVNDASTDATVEVVRGWRPFDDAQGRSAPPVRVVEGAGRGPGPAMNLGIRATDADVIMRMDGHAIPASDYLERCLDVIGETLRVVGGVWHVAPGADTAMARAIAAVVSHPLGSGGAAYRHADAAGAERLSVETVPFGTFPKALWEQLGGFDESLAANQDFDFNYRARKAGYDVVLDRRIQATYFARPTLAALWRQYSRYGFWKMQMLRKDPRAFHLRQLPPVLVAPWLKLSAVAAFIWPGALTMTAVAMYPLTLFAGALHVGMTKRVSPFAAAMAIATVHVAWSLGFWKGVLRNA